jgi:CheY-like chemotaxis protein
LLLPHSPYDILIIDDEPDLLDLTKIYLEIGQGLRITMATSAMDALQAISSQHFDAIVSDYQMPGMDGIELLKAVRSKGSNVPYILFTGRGREDVAIAALNLGADFYIQKGGDPRAQYADLRNAIIHAIHRKGAEELVQNIVDNAPLMIMIVDEERRIRTFNKAMLEYTRISPGDLIGLRCGLAFRCNNAKENEQGCGFSTHCKECRLWGAIQRTIDTGEKCLRVEAVIPTTNERGDGELVLMVSTAPIWSIGKRLALVFLEDFPESMKRHSTAVTQD